MNIIPCMREVVFRVLLEQPGLLTAQADDPSVRIEAASLEELHHEAREALIQHYGPAHSAFRVRIRRNRPMPVSGIRPVAPGSICHR
jgi:hypothetical protein